MKLWQRISFYCVICTAIVNFVGCAGTSKVTKPEPQMQKKSELPVGMNESFDPLTLGDYDLDVNEVQKEEKGELDFSFLAATSIDTASLPAEAPGYRVQIFASTDQEEANAVRRDAILRFNDNVYMIFDNPYYKVRVGDCLSRYQADDLQIKAEKKGYLDAWIVRTKVAVRKSEKTGQP